MSQVLKSILFIYSILKKLNKDLINLCDWFVHKKRIILFGYDRTKLIHCLSKRIARNLSKEDVRYVKLSSSLAKTNFLTQNFVGCSALKKRTHNPVKYLRWSFFETISRLSAVNCFRQKFHLRCLTGF